MIDYESGCLLRLFSAPRLSLAKGKDHYGAFVAIPSAENSFDLFQFAVKACHMRVSKIG